MNILDLPESHNEQVDWLERAMLGSDCNRVIAELSAVFGNASLDLTEAERQAVLESGLRELTPERFRQLLKAPTTLRALQQDVIEFGGDHWNSIALHPSQADIIQRAQPVMQSVQQTPTSSTSTNRRSSQIWASTFTGAAVGSLVTAAALLVMLSANNNQQDNQTNQSVEVAVNSSTDNSEGWGFEKFANSDDVSDDVSGNVKATDVDRKNYLEKIAVAAEAWSNKRPDTPAALAKRLGEFRMGCSAIILANHPLPAADQDWLKDRCTKWASAIENHLAELEGGMSVQEVTSRVDATVTKIAAAIKGRAATS